MTITLTEYRHSLECIKANGLRSITWLNEYVRSTGSLKAYSVGESIRIDDNISNAMKFIKATNIKKTKKQLIADVTRYGKALSKAEVLRKEQVNTYGFYM